MEIVNHLEILIDEMLDLKELILNGDFNPLVDLDKPLKERLKQYGNNT